MGEKGKIKEEEGKNKEEKEVVVKEWWELPNKYRRQRLDQLEMDVINAGGAGMVFS